MRSLRTTVGGSACSRRLEKGLSSNEEINTLIEHYFFKKRKNLGDFPGGPKTELPVQVAWVQSLTGELDPTCHN